MFISWLVIYHPPRELLIIDYDSDLYVLIYLTWSCDIQEVSFYTICLLTNNSTLMGGHDEDRVYGLENDRHFN